MPFFFLPSIPYPSSSEEGFWSPVTSTLNWCEEDYYLTIYSAEIVNTLTNLMFVYLAYNGIASCIRNRHDRVFLLAFASYLLIGLGSICFHSTLKYPMQLVDELSMIYTTCILVYAVFSHGRSAQTSLIIGLSVAALAVFITGYYHYLKNPVFHQNAFAILTVIVVLQSMYTMERILRPSRRAAQLPGSKANGHLDDAERARIDRRDAEILRNMWKLVACGLGAIGLGFLIWNLDNAFCSVLRSWRRQIGLPWGILLEGHGWWHIMTGIAAYINLTWDIWLRYCRNGRQDDVRLEWLSCFKCVPAIERNHRPKRT